MPKTYNDLYIALRKKLKDMGVEACSLEARILVAHAADKTPEKLLQDLRLYTSPEIEAKVAALTQRRLSGEPVAYITGHWEFYGHELTVNPEVLIPRSDTEVLVEKALEKLPDHSAAVRILDLCTGSGCIGCALAYELPRSRVTMIDLSREAVAVARTNARSCSLGARAVCIEADVMSPPAPQLGRFEMIVSNPPYIPAGELPTLDASVREFEPHMALDGGEDGLDFYRAITKEWTSLLRAGGWLLFEVGEDQATAVCALLEAAGLTEIGTAEDTAGYQRVVFGRRGEAAEE